MSFTVPLWLSAVVMFGVVLVAVILISLAFSGVDDSRRDAARRFGIALDRSGAEAVSRFRKRSAVLVPVGMGAGLALVLLSGSDDAALPAMYGGAFVIQVLIAVRAARAEPGGPRVAPVRTPRLRDLVHPMAGAGIAMQLGVTVTMAALLFRADDASTSPSDAAWAIAGSTGLVGVGAALAAWVWRRSWHSADASQLAADAAVRAFAVDQLVSMTLIACMLPGLWFALDVQRLAPVDVAFPFLAIVAAVPGLATGYLVQRHAKGLGSRLGLPWPPPEAVAVGAVGGAA
jgi:hypothetical protein